MKFPFKYRRSDIDFEESFGSESRGDSGMVEILLGKTPLFHSAGIAVLLGTVLIARIFSVSILSFQKYSARAEDNLDKIELVTAPRGIIYGRDGEVLAGNKAVFSAFLNVDKFLQDGDSQDYTLNSIQSVLGITSDEIWNDIQNSDLERSNSPLVLGKDLTLEQTSKLQALNLPAISVQNDFQRDYKDGEVFSSVIGYTGSVTQDELDKNPALVNQDVIGKDGVELYYDSYLRGKHGEIVQKRDALGRNIGMQQKTDPTIGKPLYLTIDGTFQKYFYQRMEQGLNSLGRTRGVALAVNPQNGEVLAFINFPVFDNKILTSPGNTEAKAKILNSSEKPLFDRAVAGFYNPGSTIKPLVGIAALEEKVIDAQKQIFSPGYLDVPNPYNPDQPTRYLDWRYQGNVNMASALAQSSDVYFYEVGGGSPDGSLRGLGITKLREWWQKFNLGNLTGIDIPGEQKGFLPSPEWKETKTGRPWLLGDTYNVSIGQGDLLLTPIQLLSYIAAVANGGKIYRPILNKTDTPKALSDLSNLKPQIEEVQTGMRLAVTGKLGTANLLNDLPFTVAAKTGSAQVMNNQQENAFFVGYAPYDNPQIAILVLVENSREGSLNAVPIAKDVLNWYYWNRIKK